MVCSKHHQPLQLSRSLRDYQQRALSLDKLTLGVVISTLIFLFGAGLLLSLEIVVSTLGDLEIKIPFKEAHEFGQNFTYLVS